MGEPHKSWERVLMEAANASFFRDRPDLQYKFDALAPPLITEQPASMTRLPVPDMRSET